MPRKSGKIALFDLDGTMADYDAALRKHLEPLMSPDEEMPESFHDDVPDHIKARINALRQVPGWWRSLQVIPDGKWLLIQARQVGFECHVLTKGPSSSDNAWTEKYQWCRANCPTALVTVTEDKSNIYGTLLVDDYPPYIEAWLEHRPRGLVIMPAQPWNQDFGHERVLRFSRNFDEAQDWLQIAYDREHGQPPFKSMFDDENTEEETEQEPQAQEG